MAEPSNQEIVKRAALLCKADLTTNMVIEFPELQGIIGYYYALDDGEHPAVALAIREHYLPMFSGDELPTSNAGISLAIADRIVDIISAFSTGEKITGNADPYGIKRRAIAILRIIIEKNLNLDLRELLNSSLSDQETKINVDIEKILDFFFERLRTFYKEEGIAANIFEAVLPSKPTKPYDFQIRIKTLELFMKVPQFSILLDANKRARNIIKQNLNPSKKEFDTTDIELLKNIMQEIEKTNIRLEDELYFPILRSHSELALKFNQYLEEFDYKNASEQKINARIYLCKVFRRLVNHIFLLDAL